MNKQPQLYIIAGANGSGKETGRKETGRRPAGRGKIHVLDRAKILAIASTYYIM